MCRRRRTEVSARPDSSGADGQNTLQLYCPYDRKVTRHLRRGTEQVVTCLECGRRIDLQDPIDSPPSGASAVHAQRTQAVPMVTDPVPLRPTRRPRARTRGSSINWLIPVVAVTVVLLVAFAAFNMVNRFVTSASSPPPAATSTRASNPTDNPAATAPAAPVEPASVRIANTDGQGAFLRRTPNLDDRMPRAWVEGTTLKVVGPDTAANGMNWKHVEDPEGNQGWIPTQYTASS
jgi:hypothetical protein